MATDQLWCPTCGAVWPPPATGELPACPDCAACVQDVRQGEIVLQPAS